ncbi:MCE family protein [Rhodococcus ruber]|uniref:MCE family protein n=1 Tax=Rhodococcus TaxID=1827 RepID=UPI00029AFAFF|nr:MULTISPECIES: MCE family protein [Rhodococcus]ATQ30773.1 mammalian cell entry protein [Rhodococcus ruber]AUM16726.1 mammalian cell entry protein [Rhodococcus ruber]AWG97718.1 MCE family protein [Rhodococcus ruber]MCF8785936.1 MCE family protein [Rhodococcus ruber]QDC13224.1 MCE family protein [Rhodococcus ruber]
MSTRIRHSRPTRRGAVAAMLVAAALTSTGCEWEGLNSLPLPGTAGHGEDAYQVRIQMPNVTTLTQNSPVRVDDVQVGSVTRIEVEDWHALVTVALDGEVALPANATARIGQTSLLGSQHLELASPTDEPPQGRLEDGDLIPLERAGVYPTTEQTLSSLSVVLNGGGLAQINDITTELNAALYGREDSIRNLLPRLDELVGTLDRQRGDIIAAMEGIDRLAWTVDAQNATLVRALDEMPAALTVLADQRQDLTTALTSLGEMSTVASRLVENSGEDLHTNLQALAPTLRALADSGNALTEVLGVLLTYPFPQAGIDQVIRGDYANLAMTIDLTLERLDLNFLTGTPLAGRLAGPEGILGQDAGLAAQSADPFQAPLEQPAAQPAPGPAATLSVPGLGEITIPGLPPLGVPAP